jgi:hypothetical protein
LTAHLLIRLSKLLLHILLGASSKGGKCGTSISVGQPRSIFIEFGGHGPTFTGAQN